jgi:hypothetical protein
MRINVRLDQEYASKLSYLMKATESTVSGVIKCAIDIYYADLQTRQAKPEEIWKQSGFIGCAAGSETLSENYKDILGDLSATKHDHH